MVAAVALLAVLSVALAHEKDEGDQDNLPHQLKNVTVCVDGDSIALHVEQMAADRRQAAVSLLSPGTAQAVQATVRRLDPHAVSRRGSCAGSSSYLAIDIRIISLDPALYRHYPAPAVSYAVWVQVGDYVAPGKRGGASPTLENLTFEGFEENVFSDPASGKAGNGGRVGAYVLDRTARLLASMVSAYQADNR